MIRLSPQRRASLQRVVFPLLILVSASAILVGKADQTMFESLRLAAADAAAPLLGALSRPVSVTQAAVERVRGALALYDENDRLREENARLLHWQQVALRLADENVELRGLLKVTPEPAVSYVTGRVIATSGGAYVRSVLVDAGRNDGVGRGQAAVTGDGLVGRVSEVGERSARILLVTDLNSRVPVLLDGSRERGVLAGDNSARPALRYLDARAAVKIGDRVVTSGDGGVFPPGLPVGIVAAIDDGLPRIEPFVALSQVDYLRIVDYGLAKGLPAPVRMVRRPAGHAAAGRR